MSKSARNANLTAAKAAKNDEYYTKWDDIASEMQVLLDYNPDAFKGKTVLLPCDDPEASNFTKYFALNFDKLGLKKLISTSRAPGNGGVGRGRIYVIERGSYGGAPDFRWDHLEGDGDFRSAEVTGLRDEADIVVTNPPFSIFREFFAWLLEGGVRFSVIGNVNAITHQVVFPLIRDGQLWLGQPKSSGYMWFEVPDNAPYNKHEKVADDGTRLIPIAARWFTNIEHGRRPGPLALTTMETNLTYGSKRVREAAYAKYDGYDAIEVPETRAVPCDYDGVMGVPITFLDKWDPEQFEILGCSYDYGRPATWSPDTKMSPSVAGQNVYKRIFIRHRRPRD